MKDIDSTLVVEPREGRETQVQHWFRICVAEWHNGVNPRQGAAVEELLVWDKGQHCFRLETHRYGRDLPHSCQRDPLDYAAVHAWALRHGEAIVWRVDATDYFPSFVRVRHADVAEHGAEQDMSPAYRPATRVDIRSAGMLS